MVVELSVGVIVGSLSRESINRNLARRLIELAPEGMTFTDIPIGGLPLYNRDFDVDYPVVAVTMKEQIARCDGVIFVTPENNRSVPGVLKNAIDWASRPWGQNVFAGKPAGVIGASTGGPGTSMAQQHLRNILTFLDMPTLNQPEAFIQYTPDRFGPDGQITDDATREFLTGWMAAYRDWVMRFAPAK